MDNKDTKRGFSGLSDLVSDTQQPPTEPQQPTAQPAESQRRVFPLLELTKWPNLPAPWSSVDSGETWVWGDFFLTFQTKPKSVLDLTMEMQGKKSEFQGIIYHYAMSVFYRIDKNPHGPSHRPIMTIALEQADMSMLTKMLGNNAGESLQAKVGSTMPLMIGLFTGETRLNLGSYEGDTSAQTVKRKFFEILGQQLGVSGQPRLIGDLEQAHGHPETGLPAKNPQRETPPSKPEDNGSTVKLVFGIICGSICLFYVLYQLILSGQNDKQPTQTPPSSSRSYASPQRSPAPVAQTPSAAQNGGQYTKPPIGTNNVLSVPEIQWCMRNGIRIDTMRDHIDTNAGVDAFNRIVNDHNSRCGSYRYRQGSQAQAERNVERYRNQIVADAIREAKQLGRPQAASPSSRVSSAPTKPNAKYTREAQQLLTDLGYDPGPVDGAYGRRTAEAVKAFQRKAGVAQDGRIDENLLNMLRKAKAEYKPQVASRPNPQAKASQQPRSNSSVMPITAKPSNLSLDEQARYTTAQRLAHLGYKVDWRTTSLRDMLDAETRLSTH